MVPFKMTTFCKHEDCPTSTELLEFQKAALSKARKAEISSHLVTCEFCDAEVEFYSHFPFDDGRPEPAESVEMPGPLFQLAEALLKKSHTDATSLDSLLKGKALSPAKPSRRSHR
jgi:hypothetical protein